MPQNKTQVTIQDPKEFIRSIDNPSKQQDCLTLLTLFQEITGEKPKMWGSSIIGYGHYTYIQSNKEEQNWFYAGFSPRKTKLSIYPIRAQPTRET